MAGRGMFHRLHKLRGMDAPTCISHQRIVIARCSQPMKIVIDYVDLLYDGTNLSTFYSASSENHKTRFLIVSTKEN